MGLRIIQVPSVITYEEFVKDSPPYWTRHVSHDGWSRITLYSMIHSIEEVESIASPMPLSSRRDASQHVSGVPDSKLSPYLTKDPVLVRWVGIPVFKSSNKEKVCMRFHVHCSTSSAVKRDFHLRLLAVFC